MDWQDKRWKCLVLARKAENDTSSGALQTGDLTGEEIKQIRSKSIPKESQELLDCKKPYRCDDPNCQRRGTGFKTAQVLLKQRRNHEG